MTYNPYFVDQNYKSMFDTKNEVGLYKGMDGVQFVKLNVMEFVLQCAKMLFQFVKLVIQSVK